MTFHLLVPYIHIIIKNDDILNLYVITGCWFLVAFFPTFESTAIIYVGYLRLATVLFTSGTKLKNTPPFPEW